MNEQDQDQKVSEESQRSHADWFACSMGWQIQDRPRSHKSDGDSSQILFYWILWSHDLVVCTIYRFQFASNLDSMFFVAKFFFARLLTLLVWGQIWYTLVKIWSYTHPYAVDNTVFFVSTRVCQRHQVVDEDRCIRCIRKHSVIRQLEFWRDPCAERHIADDFVFWKHCCPQHALQMGRMKMWLVCRWSPFTRSASWLQLQQICVWNAVGSMFNATGSLMQPVCSVGACCLQLTRMCNALCMCLCSPTVYKVLRRCAA